MGHRKGKGEVWGQEREVWKTNQFYHVPLFMTSIAEQEEAPTPTGLPESPRNQLSQNLTLWTTQTIGVNVNRTKCDENLTVNELAFGSLVQRSVRNFPPWQLCSDMEKTRALGNARVGRNRLGGEGELEAERWGRKRPCCLFTRSSQTLPWEKDLDRGMRGLTNNICISEVRRHP